MSAKAKPLDITVGPGTPVRVHVSRRPMTHEETLTRSLQSYQKQTYDQATSYLRSAGEAYAAQKDNEQLVQQTNEARQSKMKQSTSSSQWDQNVGQINPSQEQQRQQSRKTILQHCQETGRSPEQGGGLTHREPFYPPPNKTHTFGTKTLKGSKHMSQVVNVSFFPLRKGVTVFVSFERFG